MTPALQMPAADSLAARRAALSMLAAVGLCVALGGVFDPNALETLSDPVGAVRGRIDPTRLADFMSQEHSVAPFYLRGVSAAEKERAVRCLTDAIYYEAAQEPVEGQRAVAQVVVNRLRDRHFPKSVCGVVYEGWERRTGCQFSFVCDGSIARRPADPASWDRLRPLADQALNGYVSLEAGTATHYHATYLRPNWIGSVAPIAAVGKHVFYRWKGRAGLPSALQGVYQGGEFQIAERVLEGLPPEIEHVALRGPKTAALALLRARRRSSTRLVSIRGLRVRPHPSRFGPRNTVRLS